MDQARRCAKCDEQPAGVGGILCPGCLAMLAQRARGYWRDHPSGRSDERDDPVNTPQPGINEPVRCDTTDNEPLTQRSATNATGGTKWPPAGPVPP